MKDFTEQAEEIVNGCTSEKDCKEMIITALTQAAEKARKAERERCVEVVERVEVPYEQISDDEGAPDASAYLEAIIAALRQDGGEKEPTKCEECLNICGGTCDECDGGSGKEGKG